MPKRTILFNEIFEPANNSKCRYRVLKGSAGSGKSVDIAQDFVLKLADIRNAGANLLVVRKVEGSNKDSTFAEIMSAMKKMFGDDVCKYWRVTLSPLHITCLITGNEIIFRGMNDIRQREKVKSITFTSGKLIWIWCEESTELEESDIDVLDDRLRGDLANENLYYQITFTFNPVSSSHWIKRKFFDAVHEDVFTHHSTYLDNSFIDTAYYRRMERRAIDDPEGFQVYGLGLWGETGGLILTNWIVEDFDTSLNRFDNVVHGQDFGFNHANAILTVGFKDGNLYICREVYVFEKDTEEIINIANCKGLEKYITMYCDSAEPDRVQMWQKAGYKAKPVSKDSGSVNAQIDYLKQHKIYINPQCHNTIKEIGAWKWKKDRQSGLYLDEPVNSFDDAMAALRYSVEEKRRVPAKIWVGRINY